MRRNSHVALICDNIDGVYMFSHVIQQAYILPREYVCNVRKSICLLCVRYHIDVLFDIAYDIHVCTYAYDVCGMWPVQYRWHMSRPILVTHVTDTNPIALTCARTHGRHVDTRIWHAFTLFAGA